MIVDVAVDQGGCIETTHETTHDDPVYELHGVIHYAVGNMPGAVPHTSTYALTNATLPYIQEVAVHGAAAAARRDPGHRIRREHRGRVGHQRAGGRVPGRGLRRSVGGVRRALGVAFGRWGRPSHTTWTSRRSTSSSSPTGRWRRRCCAPSRPRAGSPGTRSASRSCSYEDVVAMLRDKRWHSAASKIMELGGITDPTYLARQRTSILSAEGDEHTRLRRLVGKAFSPRAADRLRPFMRDVIGSLVDAVAPAGSCRRRRRHLRAVPDPDHLRAARRAEGGLEAVQPVGHGRAADLQREPAGGPADDHGRPGRAGRVHPRDDRGAAVVAP